MDVLELIDSHEGLTFEAKEAVGGFPQSLWETYSAFANTVGGTIVLGLREEADDSYTPIGVPAPELLIKEFWDTVNNPRKVSANILAHSNVRTEYLGDAALVVIDVPRAPSGMRPIYLDGHVDNAYRRRGEGDYRCTQAQVLAMARDAAPEGADSTVLEEFGLDALATESIASYRRLLELEHPDHPWLAMDSGELLLRLGAAGYVPGDATLHPTRAGLLMFGYEFQIVRAFPSYFLDYRELGAEPIAEQRWVDRIMSSSGEWTGNILEFWSRANARLSMLLKRPFCMGEGNVRRDDTPMHAATREALTNCLVHADYFGECGVVIVANQERVSFRNPGLMRIAPDLALQGGASEARNKRIMAMFNLIGRGERAGSGFDTMRRGCAWAGLDEPLLQENVDPDCVELVFDLRQHEPEHARLEQGYHVVRFCRDGSDIDMVGARGQEVRRISGSFEPYGAPRRYTATVQAKDPWDSLTPQEYQIAVFAQEYRRVQRKDVERELGVGRSRAGEVLAALVSQGILEPVGAGRSRFYRPVPA